MAGKLYMPQEISAFILTSIREAAQDALGEGIRRAVIPLVRRNTTVPVQKSQVFTTIFPCQQQIHINVYQGENPAASQNVLLGDFVVEDLKPNRPDA